MGESQKAENSTKNFVVEKEKDHKDESQKETPWSEDIQLDNDSDPPTGIQDVPDFTFAGLHFHVCGTFKSMHPKQLRKFIKEKGGSNVGSLGGITKGQLNYFIKGS